jgi:exodeoxyribonuclease V beta subunit
MHGADPRPAAPAAPDVRRAGAGLREQKRRQRLLSFDDMLYNVEAALTSGDSPLARRIAARRYPVALIDEFQDTDPLQFAIFNAIYGARRSARPARCSSSAIPKQAIYSFRNADLHTYLAARAPPAQPYTLRHNQRSTSGPDRRLQRALHAPIPRPSSSPASLTSR